MKQLNTESTVIFQEREDNADDIFIQIRPVRKLISDEFSRR
jgi:hypothetical protein